MSKFQIDINCDLGEGMSNDGAIMPFLSSCNIACGGHTGNIASMSETVQLAKQHNVKIGAHPSFPDRENFGRKVVKLSSSELLRCLTDQVSDLMSVLNSNNLELHHIKPHGALYNLAAKDALVADIVIQTIKQFSQPIKLYAPYGSVVAGLAKSAGIKVCFEVFADRNYNDGGGLVSRLEENAVIYDPDTILKHVLLMVKDQVIHTINKEKIFTKADTVCIHGDHPNALRIVEYLYLQLSSFGISIC